MTISSTQIDEITGADVRGKDDDKIGSVGQVYVDTDGTPVWATVKTGLFGTSESFVPLQDASFDGRSLQVGYDKGFVKDAPRVDADGELSEQETGSLYDYYGMGSGAQHLQQEQEQEQEQPEYDPYAFDDAQDGDDVQRRDDVQGRDDRTPVTPREGSTGTYDETTEGRDTSGPTTDDAMTRSEERLRVGTRQNETGRARLRKHIVTEQQTVTVPVSHDEVTLEREPVSEDDAGAANSGADLSEEEHEVVLTADEVVTSKDTVAVERIKLGTQSVTEQQQVTEDVRKEQVELDDPSGTARR